MSNDAWFSAESSFGQGSENIFSAVDDLVRSEFLVNNYYLDMGVLTFMVAPVIPSPRENFRRLTSKLKAKGFIPFLRKEGDQYIIRIASKPKAGPSNNLVNLGLLAATCVTIFISGYSAYTNPIFTDYLLKGSDIVLNSLLFTISLLAIVGLHEFGHKIISRIKGIDASLPYFIPGLPPIGTFGAVILQKEPPVNKDELFDIGLAGPLVGFVVTLIVAIIGTLYSFTVPQSLVNQWVSQGWVSYTPSPLLLDILNIILVGSNVPAGYVLIATPITTAAWVGCLVTFLNLFPAFQLDGGHVAQAILSDRWFQIISVVAAIGMLLAGFWLMALLLFFMRGAKGMKPLDDVSPLSKSRRAVIPLIVIIFVLCFVVFW
jgi:Zn-dependent protease